MAFASSRLSSTINNRIESLPTRRKSPVGRRRLPADEQSHERCLRNDLVIFEPHGTNSQFRKADVSLAIETEAITCAGSYRGGRQSRGVKMSRSSTLLGAKWIRRHQRMAILSIVASLAFISSAAQADCTANGLTVTCTGTSTGYSNVTSGISLSADSTAKITGQVLLGNTAT